MRRISGIASALATHLLFACTVWHLFWFLKGHGSLDELGMSAPAGRDILVDAAPALSFAIPHSVLLPSGVRRRIVTWVRGLPPTRRDFALRAACRFLRHPVSLSFLGLICFVPVVTLDRGVRIAVWSACIFVGSVRKDRRLLFFIGDEYRLYQSRVPCYPGMPDGPLARIPLPPATVFS